MPWLKRKVSLPSGNTIDPLPMHYHVEVLFDHPQTTFFLIFIKYWNGVADLFHASMFLYRLRSLYFTTRDVYRPLTCWRRSVSNMKR